MLAEQCPEALIPQNGLGSVVLAPQGLGGDMDLTQAGATCL